MSLLTRVTEAYDNVKARVGEDLEPQEMLAYMLGYLDGKNKGTTRWAGSWYKQGFSQGKEEARTILYVDEDD